MPAIRSNEVTLMTGGEAITESFHRRLEREEYSEQVANHLKIDKNDFEKIDWAAHETAVKTIDLPAVKRILWGHHPTRARLHM